MIRLLLLLSAVVQLQAADPLVGSWLLKSQQVSGQERQSRPLLLRIAQSGESLDFEYSVPTNQKQEVTLRFTARLDGSASDVKNSAGTKIGTAKVTRAGPARYRVMLEGPRRPTSSGTLTISTDGRTLTSESDTVGSDGSKIHTVQVFQRQ